MAQDKKREAIIEAAKKRFAHFGVAKTTMTEIGNDLAISKASLYYYFPDKINLYAAVIQNIIEEGESTYDEKLLQEKDLVKAMLFFLESRTEFIIKYYNILEFLKTKSSIPEELIPVFSQVRSREMKKIETVFRTGIESGKFRVDNAKKITELYFDCLEGLRMSVKSRLESLFPEKKDFLSVLKKEKEFTQIFLKGLTI